MTPVIEVRKLHKTFSAGRKDVPALADVSFSIAQGKFVTLVGPSGCGKSTLLQILAGLIGPTSGEVRIEGEPLFAPMPDKIGMVFQDPTLLPWKTALSNVEFPLDLRGVDRAARRDRASALLDLVGLREFSEHYPHELSGGMRQRVAIARGLAQDPRLILMDEPLRRSTSRRVHAWATICSTSGKRPARPCSSSPTVWLKPFTCPTSCW